MTAVADTSPLLALASLDLLHILPRLFERTLVPPAVVFEATERRPGAPGADAIRRALTDGLLHLSEPSDTGSRLYLPAWLGPGESEAIRLAFDVGADWLVLDDRGARRYAADLGLPVLGTVRVLETARDAGLLPRVTPLLEQLRASGFRLGHELIDTIRLAESES
ncbi:MAG: DUF3368 domain-containing protein [Dehalococcoidia bacterium]|nr:DUF3368 domain-containing protein [Dehalococcoidia bacterium]